MARTKKQTLENASERKRQIQEEIFRETLAAKQTKEHSLEANQGKNSLPEEKIPESLSKTSLPAEKSETKSAEMDTSLDHSSATEEASQSDSSINRTHNSPVSSSKYESSFSGDFPKAIICIPDIYKTPVKCSGEEEQFHTSKKSDSGGESSSFETPKADNSNATTPLTKSVREPACRKLSSNDVSASLKSLKAVSEKVREEKSKRTRLQSSPLSQKTPESSPGRRSPRQHSPVTSASTHQISPKGAHPVGSPADDKPKINIFAENLSGDLGKRVRSPRRLSQDMIALPIYSAPKSSQLRKLKPCISKESLKFFKAGNDEENIKKCEIIETSKCERLKSNSDHEKSGNSEISCSKEIKCEIDGCDYDNSQNNLVTSTMASSKVAGSTNSLISFPLSKQCAISNDGSNFKSQPSLLCAMLVGGTEVANTYTQDRDKFKPSRAEISDNESTPPSVSSSQEGNSSQYLDKSKSEGAIEQDTRLGCTKSSCDSLNMDSCNNSEDGDNIVKNEEKFSIKSEIQNRRTKVKNKRANIDFLSKLKKINENVLKLLDIDVSDDFLLSLPPSDTSLEAGSNLSGSDDLPENKKGLYELISNLVSRLKESKDVIPYSTPVDMELVEKLLVSCPKSPPSVVSKLDNRMQHIEKRLEEEMLKLTNPAAGIKEGVLVGDDATKVDEPLHKDESVTNCSGFCNVPSNATTPSSSLNESLCELDVDAITKAATSVVLDCTTQEKSNISEEETCVKASESSPQANVEEDSLSVMSESEVSQKRSFTKSKTFDDIHQNENSRNSISLRRVNSSPQMNVKAAASVSSPSTSMQNVTKDAHVKSKLGSKIPIPGTSYTSRALKKTWRVPRAILEPKPLSILSELEASSQSKNVFICPKLQQYLSVPSNRIIVPSNKREEMLAIDAKALEEEEKRRKKMEEKEEKEKKIEDELNIEFSKYEPDFDEIEGMLFMSFANEVELKAHIKVEKALEWDKDDTMLRISRAKAFEEAKAHNEDMGDFKLKHLRGQHMRWKKYRRLYTDEVSNSYNPNRKEISLKTISPPKKTSDVSKIKGWKRKQFVTPGIDQKENLSEYPDSSYSYNEDMKDYCSPEFDNISMIVREETGEDKSKEVVSTRSKRRQGFSHQKEHKQLFRELRMDWEDRMIHRKLGGWSLKGNRPKEFSTAAKKRQQKKSKAVGDNSSQDLKDTSMDVSCIEENDGGAEGKDFDTSSLLAEGRDLDDTGDLLDVKGCLDAREAFEMSKKKKIVKLIYPLLTERMARNALKTLQIGDVSRPVRKRSKRPSRSRQRFNNIPALTPILLPSTPPVLGFTGNKADTPLSIVATAGSSPSSCLSTPSQLSMTPMSSSVSTATTPLALDLREEPVMEGVEIATDNISSPSIADSSSVKSCSKPGCRYGCICHLCSVNEGSAPPSSPKAKSCDKEYCRLGCICDSLDPEKPIPNSPHCGKPSCMLQCVCSETESQYGNDDIPYLPSMRKRPKPAKVGERFSNLPQREKTHRSAKNVDAITRKAMMLYETSEIYCEKVDRVKKKPDSSSPTGTPVANLSQSSVFMANGKHASSEFEIVTETNDVDSDEVMFTGVQFPAMEARSLLYQDFKGESRTNVQLPQTRVQGVTGVPIEFNDTIQTLPNMEPSAHKRKRKSHPLSNEIFSSSSCARTQPFKPQTMKEKPGDKTEETPSKIAQIEETPSKIAQTKSSSLTHATPEDKMSIENVDVDNSTQSNLPKIVSVRTQNAKEFLSSGSLWEQVDSSSQRRLSGEFNSQSVNKLADSGNSKSLSSLPPGAIKCNSAPGHFRQNHGWQTSMVCLKARAPPPPSNVSEEDVLEEDEVKLLEFAANCNWEGAKKEILSKVAQCLTRGQYPQPRTMNVCEFVVEILPKAHQPSVIPAELRSKLPGQMYSIRVRVTRREIVKKEDTNSASQIIDLSETSPIKMANLPTPRVQHAISLVKNRNDIASLLDKQKQLMVSDTKVSPEHRTTSSVGISGLGNLYINSNTAGQQNTYVSCTTEVQLKPKIISVDSQDQLPTSTKKLNVKARPQTFMKVCTSPSSKESVITVSSSSDLKMATSSANLVTTPAITANKRRTNKLKKSPVKQTVTQVIVYPKNLPVQCLEIPGEKGMMKVFMGQEANKKLIAVPVPASEKDILSKADGSSVVIVPVSGASQSKLLPILKGPQSVSAQNKLRAVSPRQWLATPPTSLLNLPAHKVSTPSLPASTKQADYITVSADAVKKYKATSSTKVLNSSDEMIMVFDAAHIKASQLARNASLLNTPKERIQIVYPDKQVINPPPVSRDHILVQPTTSKFPHQSLIDAPIDLTDESNDLNNGEGNEMVKSATPDKASSANSVKPTPSEVENVVKIPTRPKSSLIYSCIKNSPTSVSSASNSLLKKISDSADRGLKRSLLHTHAEETSAAKQRRISLDNFLNTDDDSNVSVSSGMNTHPTEAVPTSLQDRPTSVMSASLSTGSTDDVMIMLSSDKNNM
ncbi:uncharacterized protein LOC131947181 isoform X2 [Physella acuta]|uniref:uncharacterized protein LOC131947181 isoform X2 n=1 Tax=Physella acuta TaxID=109671 RepID=UPI0027DB9E50|nr:uncharacterized protein LOC131947181 isoform X2 [Physella acuta]